MNNDIAVIFDMDGVICHTNPYHSIAFREFFATRDLAPTDEEFAQHMFGKSNKYILTHFLKRPIEGEEFLALEDEKEGLFRKIYAPFVGVATSAPLANLELILSKVPVRHLFGSILASEDVQKHKPDPEVYLKSAENLSVKPDQCVVFEDSFSGVSAALNAGMKVVGVLTSHTKEELPPCNYYINDYMEMSNATIAKLF
jgi:beta-phosphoglucomutase